MSINRLGSYHLQYTKGHLRLEITPAGVFHQTSHTRTRSNKGDEISGGRRGGGGGDEDREPCGWGRGGGGGRRDEGEGGDWRARDGSNLERNDA